MVLLGAWVVVLAAVFYVAKRRGSSGIGWVTASAWLSLPVYNKLLLANCPGDCAIRVDLLLVVPALLVLTGAWAARMWRSRGRV